MQRQQVRIERINYVDVASFSNKLGVIKIKSLYMM